MLQSLSSGDLHQLAPNRRQSDNFVISLMPSVIDRSYSEKTHHFKNKYINRIDALG